MGIESAIVLIILYVALKISYLYRSMSIEGINKILKHTSSNQKKTQNFQSIKKLQNYIIMNLMNMHTNIIKIQ